jgi:hypothetical protein
LHYDSINLKSRIPRREGERTFFCVNTLKTHQCLDIKSPGLNKVSLNSNLMKKHNTFLPTLLFFVTGAIMTQAGLDSEVFAQETNASSNNNVSTSANTPITLAKGNKVGLQVEELSVTKSATAVTEVKGKIRNNNTVSVNDVKVNAQFFDKDSTVLSNTTKFVSSQSFILKPGDTLPFEFLEIISFDRVARYNITALGVVTG